LCPACNRPLRAILLILLLFCILLTRNVLAVRAERLPQQPTVSIPTVTGTPLGVTAAVNPDQEQINVRSGPSTDYPIVGVLVAGQKIPALGRSAGGDWVQISYPGVPGGVAWVYAYLVTVNGTLPIIEPPPTPTPLVTPTIDPTLAAQFVVELAPTRLPTFTQPPPVAIPTYAQPEPLRSPVGVPMGFVIAGLGVVGLFGLIVSLFRGR
jgi:hypothetical protein